MRPRCHSSEAPPASDVLPPHDRSPQIHEPLDSGLYLVSTPIGNLQDITLRALRVLNAVSLILCEDTRHSARLLQAHGVKTPLASYHEHNEKQKSQMAISRMQSGESIALISDAGTPGISDPGSVIVQEAINKGLSVIPIPGPVAFVSAAICSGLDLSSLTYLGFLPPKQGARLAKLQTYASQPSTMCFYVSPHSLRSTLADMVEGFGPNRKVCVARELTKIHEEFFRGPLSDALQEFTDREPRGEICLVVEGFLSSSLSTDQKIENVLRDWKRSDMSADSVPAEEGATLVDRTSSLKALMTRLLESGLGVNDAAKEAANLINGLSRKEAYSMALKLSKERKKR